MAGRRVLPALVAVVAAAVLPLAPAVSAPPDPTVGAPGVGDSYFPRAGNGGIDVEHYDLRLAYTPPRSPAHLAGRLAGVATIDLTTTADLRRFDLDLRGLRVRAVTVEGRPAGFVQRGGELVVTPVTVLRRGTEATVRVVYGGRTGRPTDSTGSLVGWVTTADGAIAANQPDGAPTWFPANDHPTDDATFRISVRVPRGKVAVANGELESRRTTRRHVTWTWSAREPMATYLATVAVGDFTLRRSVAAGVPVLDAVDRDLPTSASAALERTGEMITYFSGLLGPYPFSTYGAIVDDDHLGYALETQTRSLFAAGADEITVAHELAHQWLGDDVRVARWSDIWLNEGWATYLEQLWSQRRGGAGPQAAYEALLARPASDPMWSVVVSDPGPSQMFSDAVYLRGAAALHAVRLQIGEAAFFRVLRAWAAAYAGRSATTADFERLAEEVSGAHLGDLFTTWLRTPRKPSV